MNHTAPLTNRLSARLPPAHSSIKQSYLIANGAGKHWWKYLSVFFQAFSWLCRNDKVEIYPFATYDLFRCALFTKYCHSFGKGASPASMVYRFANGCFPEKLPPFQAMHYSRILLNPFRRLLSQILIKIANAPWNANMAELNINRVFVKCSRSAVALGRYYIWVDWGEWIWLDLWGWTDTLLLCQITGF